MKCIPMIVLVALAVGLMAALMTMWGCSEAATRTLTLFQFQSTKTYSGAFRIDTSGLPPNAIETTTETGGPGKPDTRLALNMDYEFEVALRLVDKKGARPSATVALPPGEDVGTARVLKQAYFGRTQVLEFLINNQVVGKPVPEYPPIRELADREFDESQFPARWQDARARCPGTKCVGYYFTLDKRGEVDAGLQGPAFFVLTVDGKVAGFWDNVLW